MNLGFSTQNLTRDLKRMAGNNMVDWQISLVESDSLPSQYVPAVQSKDCDALRIVMHRVVLAGMFLIGFILAIGSTTVSAQELLYIKKETREATRVASLQASGAASFTSPWYIIGPFDNADITTSHPPETEVDLSAKYPGAGETAEWKKTDFVDGKVHDLNRYKTSDNRACYLYRRLDSATGERARVSLGSDDQITVWLNGTKVFYNPAYRGAAPDQDFVDLDLKAGRNDVLLKIGNAGSGWEYYFNRTIPYRVERQLMKQLDKDFPPAGEALHYRVESFMLPEDNILEGGAVAFRPDGKLYVGTRRGDLYLVENVLDEDVEKAKFTLYARGLHEILGIHVVNDREMLLVQRPEITRIRDTDGDDRPDEFETISADFGVSGDYHEYIFGPAVDNKGNIFVTLNVGFGGGHQSKVPYRGFCLKVTPRGETIPWAFGLRSPNGINFSPDGRLFYTDNQGEWVAACKMHEILPGEFYGHMASVRWWNGLSDGDEPVMTPPAIWFPYSECKSATEPVWDTTGGKFGPFAGQAIVGELTQSAMMRVSLEIVNGRSQGACYVFRRGFESGVNRLCFANDGSLFAAETNRGWGSVGGRVHSLQRVRYTGVLPFEIQEMKVTPEGWDVTFTEPVAADWAANKESYSLDSYTYHHWSTYGSEEIQRARNEITAVSVEDAGRRVRLTVPQRTTGRVYHLQLRSAKSASGQSMLHPDAWYTLNHLPVVQVESSAGGAR